jgi:TonB family protein
MIKATIVLLVAYLVIPRLRRRSAAERHTLWAAALACAALMPVLTWLLPSWEPAWAQRAAGAWPARFGSGSTAIGAGDIVVRATGIESGGWTVLALWPLIWAAGSMLLLAALAAQAMRLRHLSSCAVPAHARHAAIACELAARLGLPRPRLTSSERVSMPLAWGVRRAQVWLPRAADDWPDERVWAVCAHEMAHISRGDWVAHLLAELACRVCWFHPLFWVARNHLSRESERAADDIVLGLGTSGADYASHLIDIVREARQEISVAPTVAMARGSGLERRVAALLSTLVNRASVSRARAVAIVTGACLVALPLAALGARTQSTIEIRTSNLPPLADAVGDDAAGGDSDPVRDIRVVDAAAGDVAPSVAEYTTPPLYSDEARRAKVEGVVIVRAHVDRSGRVSGSRVTKGLGFGIDQNALVALRQWRFRPGTRGGVDAPMDVEVDIGFTLRNESINAQIANDMVSLVGPGVTAPRAVKVLNPRQPRDGTAGTVVLDVVLLEDGTPRIVRILQSLGAATDDIAVRAFEQWRFSPALKDGRAIKVRMNAEVRFHG